MKLEDLEHYEPDETQLNKFNKINALSDEKWEEECHFYNDCSICPMAIHHFLLSTTKHTCVYGISEEKFKAEMNASDVIF